MRLTANTNKYMATTVLSTFLFVVAIQSCFTQSATYLKLSTPFLDSLIIDSFQKLQKMNPPSGLLSYKDCVVLVDISSFASVTEITLRIESQLSLITSSGTIIGYFKLGDIYCIMRGRDEYRHLIDVPEEPLKQFFKEAFGKQYYSVYEPILENYVIGKDTIVHQINSWPITFGKYFIRFIKLDGGGNIIEDKFEF